MNLDQSSAGRQLITTQVSPRPPSSNAAGEPAGILFPQRAGDRFKACALRGDVLAISADSEPRDARGRGRNGRRDEAREGRRIRHAGDVYDDAGGEVRGREAASLQGCAARIGRLTKSRMKFLR